jgi:hypothetical protein
LVAVSERRNAAAVLAMVSWARKQLKKFEESVKDATEIVYPDEKVAATVGGVVVGHTSRVSRRPAAPFVIHNEQAFVDWVGKRWPSEIVASVRPAFLTVLAERAEHTDGVLIDEQGEVCDAVELAPPIEYTTTRLAKNADEVLAPLLAGRSLETLAAYITEAEQPHDLDHTVENTTTTQGLRVVNDDYNT